MYNNNAYNIKNVIFMNKNRVIKIPVHSKIKIFIFFITLLVSASAIFTKLFTLIILDNINLPLPNFVFYCFIFLAMIGFGLIFAIPKIFNKKEYLSSIEIMPNDITLSYKVKDKISNIITIPTEDIKSFFAELKIKEHPFRKGYGMGYKLYYELKILITTGTPILITINNSLAKSLMLNLTRYSSYIPNFSYQINGFYLGEEMETPVIASIKREIKYCAMHGKKMPLYKSLFNLWSAQNTVTKFVIILIILLFLYVILTILFPDFYHILHSNVDFEI